MRNKNLARRWILSGFFIFIFIFPLASEAGQKFVGQINLWKRPVCSEQKNCPLPQAFGSTWTAEIEIERPIQAGTSTVKSVTLKQSDWTAIVSMYWVVPVAPERDYVVTQVKLNHAIHGFVFECSRYDGPENMNGFPTGACSGRIGTEQIGISMSKGAVRRNRR
ncbi:MAG: hypothetical protein JNM24_02590 [Bdellovibrionaceae bacterium]|nr:hypothetical protein [Pseudobdellovibrionaceae bacterium]